MRRATYGFNAITSTHGQKTNMGLYGRHLGYDYSGNNLPVVAPENLVIIGLYSGGAGGNYIEARGTYTHRFLHLSRHSLFSRFKVRVGEAIPEGFEIARSGNTGTTTGPHLHHDTRKNGTAWNAGFSNFVDWEKMLANQPAPPSSKMPPVGARIKLAKGTVRNTFRAGTTTVAGTIRVTDESFIYEVRGYDNRYPNRILINSKSAGGDGVALALYLVNGTKIEGWTQL